MSRAVSLALVLAATLLLVLGLLREDGLALVYLSIGCSAAAAVVMVVAARRAVGMRETEPGLTSG